MLGYKRDRYHDQSPALRACLPDFCVRRRFEPFERTDTALICNSPVQPFNSCVPYNSLYGALDLPLVRVAGRDCFLRQTMSRKYYAVLLRRFTPCKRPTHARRERSNKTRVPRIAAHAPLRSNKPNQAEIEDPVVVVEYCG